MKKQNWIVVTTVQAPTAAIADISRLCSDGWSGVVVGDTKTPTDWVAPSIDYLSVNTQQTMFPAFADLIPYRHYARKNIGYLYAIERGADVILETDDDNFPYASFGANLSQAVRGECVEKQGWVNVYKYFTASFVWPRGLPLTDVHAAPALASEQWADSPIQQFLADDDPDVDAIYRLLYKGQTTFAQRSPVVLNPGAWCPFNSQATAFFKPAFPLLYLPGFVSIRMTDIWRSFVAQAALWAHGMRVSFHTATVRQLRNDHNLMRDFADEIPGYQGNDDIRRMLEDELRKGAGRDLSQTGRRLWRRLIAEGVAPEAERVPMEAWFDYWDAKTR